MAPSSLHIFAPWSAFLKIFTMVWQRPTKNSHSKAWDSTGYASQKGGRSMKKRWTDILVYNNFVRRSQASFRKICGKWKIQDKWGKREHVGVITGWMCECPVWQRTWTFQEILRHVWQNAHINTIRRAKWCDRYFSFNKISLSPIRGGKNCWVCV